MTPQLDTNPVFIHADESCLGNQFKDRDRPGGAGVLIETWTTDGCERRDLWLSEPDTTNNRMAIRSAIDPLKLLNRPCKIVFVSDSQYLVRGAKEWMPGWKARGWRRKAGPIENLELWKELDSVMGRHQLEWRWIRGHDGHPRNEYANDLAIRAATDQDSSNGFVESEFMDWLEKERSGRGRYLDFTEGTPLS